jgi:tetratricopeptide (TPR) repeat protein
MTAPLTAPHEAKAARQANAEDVLARAQAGRAVIQDFVPLADSLEWQLGQQYLLQRGHAAFLADSRPVPFLINNDGSLSQNAAEVFFTALAEAEQQAPLPPELFVLELGVGVGLFARFFLDAFRDLCAARKRDYYDRLTYILADHSERMLLDVCRHGVMAGHAGRYRLRVVDALNPAPHLADDLMFRGAGPRPLRAVFLNYVLDCLPAASLEIDGATVKQLCVRICVARNVRLEDYTELTAKALAERARSADPRARQDLLEVYGLFASEYDYRPVEVRTLPHGDFAVEFGRKHSRHLLYNYGAVQAIERLLALTDPHGFLLVNDYGVVQLEGADTFEHQRFSLTTAIGLNFLLLKAFFGEAGRCQFLEPSGDQDRSLHTRLLSERVGYDTRLRFEQCFGKAAEEHIMEPLNQARQCAEVGRFELAATFYREAIRRQPRNWVLLTEVSSFLTYRMREPKAGVDLAKLALALNPTCSSRVWDALGDGLFDCGRFREARAAYERAVRLNESDLRARYRLACAHQALSDYEKALTVLAEALALDRTVEHRELLLEKQAEVLNQLGRRRHQEDLRLVNLVSKHSRPDPDEDQAPDPTAVEPRSR